MKKLTIFFIVMIIGFSIQLKAECVTGNCSNGQGTFTYDNGGKYVGQWEDDMHNGQGTLTFSWNSLKYVGQWKDNKFHGQGTLTSVNGDKYVGQFKDGKKNGQGTSTSVSGIKYVGQWKDNKFHGQGTLTFADGTKYVGQWKDGNYIGRMTTTYKRITGTHDARIVNDPEDGNYIVQGSIWANDKKDNNGKLIESSVLQIKSFVNKRTHRIVNQLYITQLYNASQYRYYINAFYANGQRADLALIHHSEKNCRPGPVCTYSEVFGITISTNLLKSFLLSRNLKEFKIRVLSKSKDKIDIVLNKNQVRHQLKDIQSLN